MGRHFVGTGVLIITIALDLKCARLISLVVGKRCAYVLSAGACIIGPSVVCFGTDHGPDHTEISLWTSFFFKKKKKKRTTSHFST